MSSPPARPCWRAAREGRRRAPQRGAERGSPAGRAERRADRQDDGALPGTDRAVHAQPQGVQHRARTRHADVGLHPAVAVPGRRPDAVARLRTRHGARLREPADPQAVLAVGTARRLAVAGPREHAPVPERPTGRPPQLLQLQGAIHDLAVHGPLPIVEPLDDPQASAGRALCRVSLSAPGHEALPPDDDPTPPGVPLSPTRAPPRVAVGRAQVRATRASGPEPCRHVPGGGRIRPARHRAGATRRRGVSRRRVLRATGAIHDRRCCRRRARGTWGLQDARDRPLVDGASRGLPARPHRPARARQIEHLLDDARTVAELLSTGTGTRILVTSGSPLSLVGAHEFPVPPLPVPQADEESSRVAFRSAGARVLPLRSMGRTDPGGRRPSGDGRPRAVGAAAVDRWSISGTPSHLPASRRHRGVDLPQTRGSGRVRGGATSALPARRPSPDRSTERGRHGCHGGRARHSRGGD